MSDHFLSRNIRSRAYKRPRPLHILKHFLSLLMLFGLITGPYQALAVSDANAVGSSGPKGDQGAQPDQIRPPLMRGTAGDNWADVVLGKPDFASVAPNTATDNSLFWVAGVAIDKTGWPAEHDKLYVYDAGNNRILGISDLQACTASPSTCVADLVIGQTDFHSTGCNGDTGFQRYPVRSLATASTLCTHPHSVVSVAETGSGASMDIDSEGSLYVIDYFNYRVLKYIDPFGTDTVADEVWGQPDMQLNTCNGNWPGGANQISNPTTTTLCFDWGHSNSVVAGVDIDLDGNMWVADTANSRVLRFPNVSGSISHTPDIVFGQSNFVSRVRRSVDSDPSHETNRFSDVVVVRVNDQGWVYTTETGDHTDPADADSDRVLVFTPTNTTRPYTYQTTNQSGKYFKRQSSTGLFRQPTGIEFVADTSPGDGGSVWVLNGSRHIAERWAETEDPGTQEHSRLETIGIDGSANPLGAAQGSFGIDSEGYRYIATGGYGSAYRHSIMMFSDSPNPAWPIASFLTSSAPGNDVTNYGMSSGVGVAIAGDQVIAADDNRLLYWNNRTTLQNGEVATGTVSIQGSITGLATSKDNHLYVAIDNGPNSEEILVYTTPLTTTSVPLSTNLKFPFTTISGEVLPRLDGAFYGVQPAADSTSLWIGHKETSRAFRVRNPLTNPQVDVILGQDDPYGMSRNRQPVSFTTAVNVTVSGNSIEKTGGVNGNWDAGAISTKSFVEDGAVSVKIPATQGSGVAFGLNHDNQNANYTDLDYGFIVDSSNQLKIYEGGSVVLTTAWATGDVLTIQFEEFLGNHWVNYFRNDTSLRRQFTTPTFPLFFDSSIRDSGSKITSAKIGGRGLPMLADTLNYPGAVVFDRKDNVYVSDHSTEINGNIRLLEFNSSLFPASNTSVIYAPPASKIFPDLGTWQPSFNSQNHMVVGYNAYTRGSANLPNPEENSFFPGIYLDPLSPNSTRPDAFLYDFHSMAFGTTFDSDDNLYTTDGMRGHVLVYKRPRFGRPVRWVEPVAVTVTGNSIQKTSSGVRTGWDADAVSDQKLLFGDGYVEVVVDATNTARAFGLNQTNSTRSYTDIDFAIAMQITGTLAIYENGTWRTSGTSYAVNDLLKVAIEGGVVKYYKIHDGTPTTIYTSTVAPNYPLMADTSIYTLNGKITDAYIAGLNYGNVVWTNPTNVTVTGNSIEKTSGTNGSADAGALSDGTIRSGEGYAQITVDATNTDRYFGLGYGDTNANYTNITYTLHLKSNATLEVVESGTVRSCGNCGAYSVGDRLKVEVNNGKVKYYQNSNVLYESGVTPTYPMKLDTSILTLNGKITNAIISGNNLGDVTWKKTTNVSPYGNSIGKTAGVNGQWDAGASSDRAIESGTGYAETTIDRCEWWNYNEYRHFGLNNADNNANFTDIDFSISLEGGCTFAIYENGTWKYDGGGYGAGDVFKVGVKNNEVKYYKNGTAVYTSTVTPSFPLYVDTSIRTYGTMILNAFINGDNITK